MSTQATHGSADSSSAPTYAGSTTNIAMSAYLRSNEAPLNAQLVGSPGTVNTVPNATQRASYQIQNLNSLVPPSDHANHSTSTSTKDSRGAAH